MIKKRLSDERGVTKFDWLDGRHTFSFGEYYDPAQMSFRSLRVINEDIVSPGGGFPTHPHRDAEIFTYVIEGALQHQDSMGNESVIKAGNLQYMSAGSGVRHSEFNASKTEPVHLLQIWLLPNVSGGEPRYAEKQMGTDAKENALTTLFAGKGEGSVIPIRQDAGISFGRLDTGSQLALPQTHSHHWIQLIKGELSVLGETLRAGDGLAISNETVIAVKASSPSEFIVFHLE
ncbi:MAG: pirin family protein [Chthoniobacterales bacterium]